MWTVSTPTKNKLYGCSGLKQTTIQMFMLPQCGKAGTVTSCTDNFYTEKHRDTQQISEPPLIYTIRQCCTTCVQALCAVKYTCGMPPSHICWCPFIWPSFLSTLFKCNIHAFARHMTTQFLGHLQYTVRNSRALAKFNPWFLYPINISSCLYWGKLINSEANQSFRMGKWALCK